MVTCISCGGPFVRPVQRGRPAVRCPKCRLNPALESKAVIVNTSASIASPGQEVSSSLATTANVVDDTDKYHKYDNAYPYQFRIYISNLGLAFGGNDYAEAVRRYKHYVVASDAGFGQVGRESVELHKLNAATNLYDLQEQFIPERYVA